MWNFIYSFIIDKIISYIFSLFKENKQKPSIVIEKEKIHDIKENIKIDTNTVSNVIIKDDIKINENIATIKLPEKKETLVTKPTSLPTTKKDVILPSNMLSEHFSEAEFLHSDTAIECHINNKWNDPSHKQNAILLCKNIMEKIREKSGYPIIISSGYRNKELNAEIKGEPTSQHCKGQACDFHSSGMNLKKLFNMIIDMNLPFDQLIFEGTWIHISYSSTRSRKDILLKTSTGYKKISRI